MKTLAPQHPQWPTTEPFASIWKGDVRAALAGGNKSLIELIAAPSTGMTTAEFEVNEDGMLSVMRATSLIEKTSRFELFHVSSS